MHHDTRGAHMPALDGLRGVAVLLVILCHAILSLAPTSALQEAVYRAGYAGWVGVDLFFVLSGFLITGILLDAKGAPGYYRAFYARRVLRIFPLYYAALIVLFVIGSVTSAANSPEFSTIRAHQAWYWGYAVNWGQVVNGGQAATPLHTTHLWSLAVEEQFYLIWPLVVACLSRRALARLCGAILVLSPIIRLALRLHGVSGWAVYVATPTHMDGLAVGALLSLVARAPAGLRMLQPWVPRTIAISGLIVLSIAIARRRFAYADIWVQGAGYTALAIGFGALLVWSVTREPDAPTWIAHPVLRFFGKYSYALYLLHYPWLLAVTWLIPATSLVRLAAVTLITLGGATLLALASWHLLERRFHALKRYVPMPGGPERVAA